MKDFLKLDELAVLNDTLFDNGFDDVPMTIIFDVPTREMLMKINEEIYYKTGTTGEIEDVDEVRLSTGGNIIYIYRYNPTNGEDSTETTN